MKIFQKKVGHDVHVPKYEFITFPLRMRFFKMRSTSKSCSIVAVQIKLFGISKNKGLPSIIYDEIILTTEYQNVYENGSIVQ